MMPGVPDFYQGTEFWDLSLVDPDNRRPVDFAERAAVLAKMEAPDWADLTQNWRNGHVKLAWTRHLLKLRTELAGVFADGDYQPLAVSGPHRDHVIAFARRRGRDAAIVVVTKALAAFSQGGRVWPDAEAFDGTLSLARLFGGRRRRRGTAALQSFPASAGGGAEGQIRRHLEAGAKASSRLRPLQLFLVSNRSPRFLIATLAISANRCSSKGSVTSSRHMIVRHIDMT